MSLSSAIAKATSAAFKATGDLKTSVTITTLINTSYNSVSDAVTGTSQSQTVNGLLGSFTQYQIANSNGTILFNDIKLIIESAELQYDVHANSVFTIDGVSYKLANPANTGRSATGISSKTGDFVRTYQLRAM